MIHKNSLVDLVEGLRPAIDKYNKTSRLGPLSFFEVYTALAFAYFREEKVDFVVLETGLGGRLDATNVVESLVCAITPISYEHTQKLGNTLIEIVHEKAGIIKRYKDTKMRDKLTVISAPQEREVIEVIRNRCRLMDARLYEVDRDITYNKTQEGFNVKAIFNEYQNLKVRLVGQHQIINAAVAIGIIEALQFYGIGIESEAVRKGLYNTLWPGRCEIVSKRPLTVLDGAQNVASAKVLKQTIKENFNYKRLILVLGISKDKDIPGICRELNELGDEIILTRATNPRASPVERIVPYLRDKRVHLTNNVSEARDLVRRLARNDDLILVCGSLFVVGEFRNGGIRT
ncbi:MAG: Mur ligase family protein, partial [Candidatus Omnitrophica bacterium]|nr:Mur ligase family protein [Candidatus Omnitrophota bacterium]